MDWARIWIDAPIAPTPATQSLAPAGVGLRMQWLKRLIGELDWGYPVQRQDSIDAGQQRIDFKLAYEF